MHFVLQHIKSVLVMW